MNDKPHWLNRARSKWVRTYGGWIPLHALIAVIEGVAAAALFAIGSTLLACLAAAFAVFFVVSVAVCATSTAGS